MGQFRGWRAEEPGLRSRIVQLKGAKHPRGGVIWPQRTRAHARVDVLAVERTVVKGRVAGHLHPVVVIVEVVFGHAPHVVCGVRCAVCGVRCAMCGVRCVVLAVVGGAGGGCLSPIAIAAVQWCSRRSASVKSYRVFGVPTTDASAPTARSAAKSGRRHGLFVGVCSNWGKAMGAVRGTCAVREVKKNGCVWWDRGCWVNASCGFRRPVDRPADRPSDRPTDRPIDRNRGCTSCSPPRSAGRSHQRPW